MKHNDHHFKIVIKTSFGLEDVLINELHELNILNCEKGNRAVSIYGDLKTLYQINLWLRTANKILVTIHSFTINSVEDLYNKTKEMPWEEIFDVNQTFAIDSTVFSEFFNHTKYAAFKCKDAIVDRFREKVNKRPNIDTTTPNIKINLHIDLNHHVTISLDSSGDPLFKRAYRVSRSIAPIKEDLAAGLVLLSQWDKKSTFIDLFCGSGTILIEAALLANNIPPNINRAVFGFMNWKNFDEKLFDDIVQDALNQEIDNKVEIIGVEIDGRTLGMCRANIRAAGLSDKIKLFKKDFTDFSPNDSEGLIVSNPPYGERIGDKINDLYATFGDELKAKYTGWNAWIISGNMDAIKKVGLRSSRKISLYNGNIQCKFMKYTMYKGTKKAHKIIE